MKKLSALVMIMLLSTALIACGTDKTGDTSSNNHNELIVAADQDPVGLDPQTVPAASSSRIYSLVYDSLTKLDHDFQVQPNLAESWEITNEGKTITYKLRQNVKFHNGKSFDSGDVKFSFERLLNPDTGAISKSFFSSIDRIDTPDKYTVVFQLKHPDSAFLINASSASASIVPNNVDDLNKEAVGTGPFKLDKLVSGQYVLLSKNEDYHFKDLPKVNAIRFNIMKDSEQRIAALRAGKVDIASIDADAAQILKKANHVKTIGYQSMEYSYLGINVAKPPFDDPKVRQAISYAVDRNQIIDTVWKGQAAPTGPIAPAQKTFALSTDQYPSYKRDLNKAKQLLEEAGYPDGFDTTIQTSSTYPDMTDSAQIIQQNLKEIGINAKIEQLEWGKYIDLWKSKKMDLMVGRNTSGSSPDRSLRFFFATDGSANVWNYSSPQFDKFVGDALKTTSIDEQKELYESAQSLLVNDAPNLFLASPENFYAVNTRVQEFAPSAIGESDALLKAKLK